MTIKELMEQVDTDRVTEAFCSHIIFFKMIVMISLFLKNLMQFLNLEN